MEAWHGTHMIEHQKTCLYGASYKTTIMILLYGLYEGELRQQQELLFLWLHLGEYGQEFSHTFHDISREEEGTFQVQGGYPSALEDYERLPYRKKIFSHSNVIVDGFGIWNVKGGVME